MPWWIASDDVEESSAMLHLSLCKLVEGHVGDTFAHRDGPELLDVRFLLEIFESLIIIGNGDSALLKVLLQNSLLIRVFFLKKLLFEVADMVVDFFDHVSERGFIPG